MLNFQNGQSWYLQNRHALSGQGLWMRGDEMNTLDPIEWNRRELKVLLTRLSTYMDVGYSFTHPLLYQWAASLEGVFPDMAYLPPPKDAAVMRQDGVPWLIGTQTKRTARDFDVIGFSNSIVQELLNIKPFLETSGIPLHKSERSRRAELGESVPIIVMGGANALFSWSVLLGDPWVDGVYVGESDDGFKALLAKIRDGKRAGHSRAAILESLTEIPGFFQPERAFKTKKNFVMNLNASEPLRNAPVLFHSDQAGAGHLQISEGCPCFCSFCAEAWERRPYRERKASVLLEQSLAMKAALGLETLDIYSFNFNMHSELYQVLWDLVPHFRHIGLKSQRFDLLAHDPEMLKFQQTLNKTSITCGLEGISPRLREYLNKNVSVEELHASLTAIFKNKARELKVFLIATGLEEEQDFEALGDFLDHVREMLKQSEASTRVIFSMTPLVRFPWTPLEFEDAPTPARLTAIVARATQLVRGHGFEFRESADLPEFWVSQVLARADRQEIRHAIERALEQTKFVYYREVTPAFRDALEHALEDVGVDIESVMRGFDLESSRQKPWAQVDIGVFREFLWKMFQSLQKFKSYDYCLGRSWAKAKCSHCGGCPTRFHVRDIVLAKQTKPYTFEAFKQRHLAAMHDEVRVRIRIRLQSEAPRHWIGVPRRFAGVDVARALMKTVPESVAGYRGWRGSRWDAEAMSVWIEGADVFEFGWSKTGAGALFSMGPAEIETISSELAMRGMEWLGWVEESASTEHRLEIRTPLTVPLGAAFSGFLQREKLKHSLRRVDAQTLEHDWTPSARKKDVLKRAILRKTDAWELSVDLGQKFNWDKFSKSVLGDSYARQPWTYRITVNQAQ